MLLVPVIALFGLQRLRVATAFNAWPASSSFQEWSSSRARNPADLPAFLSYAEVRELPRLRGRAAKLGRVRPAWLLKKDLYVTVLYFEILGISNIRI